MKIALRIAVLALVIAVPIGSTFGDPDDCVAGAGVYSPVTGELADCLEGGGEDCLVCSGEITVKP